MDRKVTANTSDSVAMIERLVGFDTVSSRSNLPLISFAEAYLRDLGVPTSLTYDCNHGKANLSASIGPVDRPGIVLSGHSDVVPAEGQAWSGDPFTLRRQGERLIGRGTSDMKSFVAIMLAKVPAMLARPLAAPIHLAISYDEEVGCLGAPMLIDDLLTRVARPEGAIIGEPSGMEVIRGHKGKIVCHVTVTGLDAHSGVPHLGVNAVEAAGEIIAFLNRLQARLKGEAPAGSAFEPPYTSLQCCMVAGGTAVNLVPARCDLDFDIRFLPGVDPAALVAEARAYAETVLLPAMRRHHPAADIVFTPLPGCFPLLVEEASPIVRLAQDLSGAKGAHLVGFGTEAGDFQRAGIAAAVCGPGMIDQAHQPDEWIGLDQVARCEQFIDRLIARQAA